MAASTRSGTELNPSSLGLSATGESSGGRDTTAAGVAEPSNCRGNLRQALIAVNVALSYIIVGASIAWAAPLLYEGKKTGQLAGQKLGPLEGGIVGSSLFLAAAVMPIPTSFLREWIGNKKCLIAAGITSCLSWLLLVFVSNVTMLYLSRIFGGLMTGVVMTLAPLYISEIARPKIRGMLGSVNSLMLQLGATITFILGPNIAFRNLAIICGVFPHVFVALMFLFPESPYWLIQNGKRAKAQESFEWLRGRTLDSDEKLREEFEEIVKSVDQRVSRRNAFARLCHTRAKRRALFIVESLTVLQRLSGVTAILAYSSITMPDRSVGILTPTDCVTVLGVVWTLTLLFGILLIDRVGRIPLLLLSSFGCFAANSTVGTWFYVVDYVNPESHQTLANPWFPFFAFLTYGCFYCLGLAQIPGVLQGEMFAMDKELASAVTVIVMGLTSCFVNGTYVAFTRNIGVYFNFALYSIACIFAIIFTLGFVPETKGKPLHDIQKELALDL